METLALRDAAQARMDEYLTDLARIVNMDSGTYTPEGVALVADAFQGWFSEAGALVERIAGKDGFGPHIIGRWPGSGRGRILLIGHMDTVFPAGEAARRPFHIADGHAHGPGVLDMKSGLLVGLYAARLLRAETPWAELTLLCTSDEEVGSPTSHDLIAHLASEADAALVLEPSPSVEQVTVARKGVGMFRLEVSGVAAHAGVEPEKGANAAVELAHRIILVHMLNGTIPDVTLNVGVVAGGERPNIVAEQAHAVIDVRAPDPESLAAIEAALQRLADLEPIIAGTATRISGGFVHRPFTQSAESARLFAQAEAVARALGVTLAPRTTGGGSDGNTTAAIGKPTLDGLGPAGEHAHNSEEYIEIASVAPRIALLAGLIARTDGREA